MCGTLTGSGDGSCHVPERRGDAEVAGKRWGGRIPRQQRGSYAQRRRPAARWSRAGGECGPKLEGEQVVVALTGEDEGSGISVKIQRVAVAPTVGEQTNGADGG
jgi:hypothetical protein